MKIRLILAMTAAFLMGLGLSTARAASTGFAGSSNVDAFTLVFDEFSNGFLQNPTGSNPVPLGGTLQNDPTVPAGGTPRMVLTFVLPMPVVTGDVRIFEPGGSPTAPSDLLRFTNAGGGLGGAINGDRLIFYSELPEPGETLVPPADTGLPPMEQWVPRDGGGITEVGPEGNNSFVWIPNGVNDNIYIGLSDGVIPEPASIISFGLGMLGLGFCAWRRRKRAAA